MSEYNSDSHGELSISLLSEEARSRQVSNHTKAKVLFDAYNAGEAWAIAEFRDNHPQGKDPDFTPTLLQARMMVSGSTTQVRRLSLEKLKKEAKELLKHAKAGNSEALMRFEQHPRVDRLIEFKLADAQLVIARENGLPSWPKLKTHIELMNSASTYINNKAGSIRNSPDNDLKTVHVRCGCDIKHALEVCGFNGDFLEVSNPFMQGPVTDFDPLDEFVDVRSQFISNAYAEGAPDGRIEGTPQEIRDTEIALRSLAKNYQRIVLWFEHDPYDQVCLSYVLAHIANQDVCNTTIECVQINSFPGVKKFIGIGQLSQTPEAILVLWQNRLPITSAMIALGARYWQAFISNEPTELWLISQENHQALPYMQASFKRVLKELPWLGNGLSLTEQLSLDIISTHGPLRAGGVFNLLMTESEPLPFLGDIMMLSALRELWGGENPAIEIISCDKTRPVMGQRELTVTLIGKQLLNNKAHWVKLNTGRAGFEKWIGGVVAKPDKKNWYWSPTDKKPVYV